jgi:hypothetical protein
LSARAARVDFSHPSAKPQYPSLPSALVAAADIATNGEFFFPGDRAADAARALAAQDLAITGGEVYCRRSVGWAAYLGEWTTPRPPGGGEPWGDRVARGLADALRMVGRPPTDWGEPDASPPDLRFFFASLAPSSI